MSTVFRECGMFAGAYLGRINGVLEIPGQLIWVVGWGCQEEDSNKSRLLVLLLLMLFTRAYAMRKEAQRADVPKQEDPRSASQCQPHPRARLVNSTRASPDC
jgi:hypothetical protein